MSDIVQQAIERREHLLAELCRLDQFLETASRLTLGEASAGGAPVTPDRTPVAKRVLKASGVVDVVSDVLRATGRPMTRGELYQKLQDVGVQISGDDPLKNLGTILWRSGKFDNTGRAYWFKDEPRQAQS